jgi:hypothetical protein
MTTTTKTEISSNLAACASGLTANFPATQTWVFSGKTYGRADILNLLQGFILATQTTKTTNEAWRTSVEVESAQLAALHPVLAALKKALEAQFGARSTKMAEFGFVPAKTPVKTAASKAASAARATATRKAKKAALATVKTTVAAPPATPLTASAPSATPVTASAPPSTPVTASPVTAPVPAKIA